MPRKKYQLYKNKSIHSDKQKYGHCTYNVTKMRVRKTIVAVERHSQSVFVAVGVQHAMACPIFICCLSGSTIFSHNIP